MRRAILFLCLVMWSTTPAPLAAQSYFFCDEPQPPNCIDRYGTFDDDWSFNRCRNDVGDYVEEVARFQSCLAEWHGAAGREADDVVDEFNCRAQGQSYC